MYSILLQLVEQHHYLYDERIREVERGTFSPLVFSSSSGMGPLATVVYKRITTLIFEKRGHPYCHVLYWLRSHLCFLLLRSAVMCLRDQDQAVTYII